MHTDPEQLSLALSYERSAESNAGAIHAQYTANCDAAQRDGFRIPDDPEARFTDNGESGLRYDRPALSRLLGAARAGELRGRRLYMADVTRLHRSPDAIMRLIAEFNAHGVAVHTADGDLRGGMPSAWTLLTDVVARTSRSRQPASECLRRRDRLALQRHHRDRRLLDDGLYPANCAPYGLRLEPVPTVSYTRVRGGYPWFHRLVTAWDERTLAIAEIAVRYAGGETCGEIARDLNARCIPSPGQEGCTGRRRVWTGRAVYRALTDPLYAGDLTWYGRRWHEATGEHGWASPVVSHAPVIYEGFLADPPICGTLLDRVRMRTESAGAGYWNTSDEVIGR